jgi:predicted SAM-dependent methyltransferase
MTSLFHSILKKALRRLNMIFRSWRNYFHQYIRTKLLVRMKGGHYKIIVGSSATAMSGWISTEYPYVDITKRDLLLDWFGTESVSAILAEHVLEHLTTEEASLALGNLFEILEPGGYFRIAVPDGFHPNINYIDDVKPGGLGSGSEDHKVLYTITSLTEILVTSGYSVRPLEWFDSEGIFRRNEWSPKDGMVTRSSMFDERNIDKPLSYTSLIVDAYK